MPVHIELTGRDFKWEMRYRGPDRATGTADDPVSLGDLHLPVGLPVVLHLRSEDYIYTFELPIHGVRDMAIPDLPVALEFEPERLGRSPLLGDQMCGYSHPDLMGEAVVHSKADFVRWLDSQAGER